MLLPQAGSSAHRLCRPYVRGHTSPSLRTCSSRRGKEATHALALRQAAAPCCGESAWGMLAQRPSGPNSQPCRLHCRLPLAGSSRPSDSGASRWGQRSSKARQERLGACHLCSGRWACVRGLFRHGSGGWSCAECLLMQGRLRTHSSSCGSGRARECGATYIHLHSCPSPHDQAPAQHNGASGAISR